MTAALRGSSATVWGWCWRKARILKRGGQSLHWEPARHLTLLWAPRNVAGDNTILERAERAIVEAKHSGRSCISAARRRSKKHSKERSMLDGILLTVTPVSQMAQDRSWGCRHGGELDQMTKPCLEKHRCGHVPLGSSRFQCNWGTPEWRTWRREEAEGLLGAGGDPVVITASSAGPLGNL